MAINQHKYHKIWNDYHPDDPNNLQKMTRGRHKSLHNKGENNPSKKIEVRIKLSERLKGNNNPMYGKHHSESTKEKMSKANKGENCYKAKLTWSTVNWIRDILNSEEYKEAKSKKLINQTKLAELFGVSYVVISEIKHNKIWRIKGE